MARFLPYELTVALVIFVDVEYNSSEYSLSNIQFETVHDLTSDHLPKNMLPAVILGDWSSLSGMCLRITTSLDVNVYQCRIQFHVEAWA